MSKIQELHDKFLEVQNKVLLKKQNLATALQAKGATVTADNTWTELNNAVVNIQTKAPEVEITKLNVAGTPTTPYVKTVTLTNPIIHYNVLTNVREFTTGTSNETLVCSFNNGDASSFTYTADKVLFDGTMHLPGVSISGSMTSEGALGDGELWSYTITKSDFYAIDEIVCTDGTVPQITVNGTSAPQIIVASSDINITGINELSAINFNSTTVTGGKMLLAISVDGGISYKSYNTTNSTWDIVDINSLSDFAAKGMPKSVTDTLTDTQLGQLRNGSTKIRFAYYLEDASSKLKVNTDSIAFSVLVTGGYKQALDSDYDVVIHPDTNTVDFKFYKNGIFTMNYLNE